jgi:hypothetical protein
VFGDFLCRGEATDQRLDALGGCVHVIDLDVEVDAVLSALGFRHALKRDPDAFRCARGRSEVEVVRWVS